MYAQTGKRIINEAFTIFIACASLCICTAALRFVVIPGLNDMNGKKVRIEYFNRYIKAGEGNRKLQHEMDGKNALLRDKLFKLAGSTNVASISEMLELLINKAGAADIRFVKMQPQTQPVQGSQPAYPVILEMNTTYHSLGRFVASLETLPHIVKIRRLGIETLSEGRVQVRILVDCYVPEKEQS